ncbi:MAG: SUMF1/EgtB/PvdO family nonheme iron enzyme [Acidobacteriota bacterium]
MAEWREIPGNPDVFEKLVELLRSGEAVGFVGAGASAGLYPLWPRLIEELADAAVAAGADPAFKSAWLSMDALEAASQIRQALGEGPFSARIEESFGPKTGADGLRYTATHAALARFGCSRFVTTNFDPALRLACQAERPDLVLQELDWRDEHLSRWHFYRPAESEQLPILYAHGKYDAKESLVLDAESYRRAYSNTRYREVLKKLWMGERLLVVGFSFEDHWLSIFADLALSESGVRDSSDRRHFALIGLPVEQLPAAFSHRRAIESRFHLRALFYPVSEATDSTGKKREDHSALGQLLEDLITAKRNASPAPTSKVAPKPETIVAALKLAEDDLEERAKVFEGLPEQLADPSSCLVLVEQLKEGCRNGFDLYWLWWIVEETQRRWPRDPRAGDLLERFFDHIPAPEDPELFKILHTPLDGAVKLWVEVSAGEAWVGSPQAEEGRDGDEGPQHRVRIPASFWLGAGTVTNTQYAAFDPHKAFYRWEHLSSSELRAHPRVDVTWFEAVSFCRWLGRQPGFEGTEPRLPIEEELEVACRAGTKTRFWRGDDETDLKQVGWFQENSERRAHRVGEKPANDWGFYDIHGNVWEWTTSPWDEERYQNRRQDTSRLLDAAAVAADLAAPPSVWRVVRGGGYWDPARGCRSACRDFRDPRYGFGDQGFRVLLSSAPVGEGRESAS